MADIISEYTHPKYADFKSLWKQMRDTNEGEYKVKKAGIVYLPMTDGQLIDYGNGKGPKSDEALKRYESYKMRAIFPNYVSDTIISMLGVMYNEKPKKIELPEALEPMRENSTPHKDSIEMLMRRTNENQLLIGRRGLLLDVPEIGDVPKVIEYAGESMLNWEMEIDEGSNAKLSFVLLDESNYELVGMKWEWIKKYRLLALDGSGNYYTMQFDEEDDWQNINLAKPPEGLAVYPQLKGNMIQEIPFVFVNATSNLPDIEKPPLLALSDLCLSIYRGDSGYRLHLYQQAQDTPFFKGFEEKELEKIRMGSDVFIGTTNTDADAKMLSVGSTGLSEERTSLENLHASAINMGIALVEQKQAESGEALKTRLSVKTASMSTIALSGARGIETLLQIASKWIGANPEDVVIEPNLDFSSSEGVAKDLLDYWTTTQAGAPLSEKSFHEYARKKGFTDMEYDQEKEEIEEQGSVPPITSGG